MAAARGEGAAVGASVTASVGGESSSSSPHAASANVAISNSARAPAGALNFLNAIPQRIKWTTTIISRRTRFSTRPAARCGEGHVVGAGPSSLSELSAARDRCWPPEISCQYNFSIQHMSLCLTDRKYQRSWSTRVFRGRRGEVAHVTAVGRSTARRICCSSARRPTIVARQRRPGHAGTRRRYLPVRGIPAPRRTASRLRTPPPHCGL